MGKISPISAKYIVHADINIEGVVDKPDVIGAIFGQTEGLLGNDLELRELQRSGRIGRIEVSLNTSSGKTTGSITIPSSLDKAETAIVAAALEVIQRIGPCNAKINVGKIEDVRVSKRNFVIDRAKKLLRELTENTLPDSQELADEVAQSVRVMEIQEYGRERLPAGPHVDESDELIVVEGRADVINLLKHGIKNVVALNGTSAPQIVKDLSKKKIITVFVDGDRGGDLIIKELLNSAEVDFVCKAPDGKEVEEITKKEIHKSLRGKIAAEQMKFEIGGNSSDSGSKKSKGSSKKTSKSSSKKKTKKYTKASSQIKLSGEEKKLFRKSLDDLIGTRGAYLLNEEMDVLGKVPLSELNRAIESVGEVYAVILDGTINKDLTAVAKKAKVKFLVGMDSKIKDGDVGIKIITDDQF